MSQRTGNNSNGTQLIRPKVKQQGPKKKQQQHTETEKE